VLPELAEAVCRINHITPTVRVRANRIRLSMYSISIL
jgi:hypothetical protein